MNIILFDFNREEFLPLTFTRPVGDLRCGTLTMAQRWSKLLDADFSFKTEDYLTEKFPLDFKEDAFFINPCVFPSEFLVEKIKTLKKGKAIFKENILIAANVNLIDFEKQNFENQEIDIEIDFILYPWDLFSYNFKALKFDFELLTRSRDSQELSSTNGVIGDKNLIFLEEGVKAEYCTFNTSEGSIYLAKNAQVSEGSNLRGPISLGENSIINMGSKIYGGTTIGDFCKIGGEVNNSIFWGYSNKGHEGFVGNSVIGQWCNFGADSNTSNMKNNYADVKCWSFKEQKFINTKLQFCGTIFGDHSKTAINTQLNTGTIVGVFANIFTPGFPPNLVESFAWGGERNGIKFKIDKVNEIADRVMKRRNVKYSEIDENILKYLYDF